MMKASLYFLMAAMLLSVTFIRTTGTLFYITISFHLFDFYAEGIPSTDSDSDDEDFQVARAFGKRFACNSITGDYFCAGWTGAWRCNCGAACYNNVCTCKRCI